MNKEFTQGQQAGFGFWVKVQGVDHYDEGGSSRVDELKNRDKPVDNQILQHGGALFVVVNFFVRWDSWRHCFRG